MGKARLGVLTVAVAACLAVPSMAQAVEPIVFVHGWNSSGSTWNTMASRFRADGWTAAQTVQWSYNTSQSNATTAAQLSTLVDQVRASTGSAKVDLISHSMGGLSTRYYVKNLGGGAKVAFSAQADAPSCAECGSIMIRNGSCYKCLNCGSTSGCS